eukprot:3947264-Amphidinium_carterae.2
MVVVIVLLWGFKSMILTPENLARKRSNGGEPKSRRSRTRGSESMRALPHTEAALPGASSS